MKKFIKSKIAPTVQNPLEQLMDIVYPVGSMYWTESKDFNPNEQFTGTWERVKDKFIYAYGDGSEALGTQAGSNTVTLQTANLPSHSHTMSHSHTINHDHAAFTSGSGSAHSHGLGGRVPYNNSLNWQGDTHGNLAGSGYKSAVTTDGGAVGTLTATGSESSHTHTIDVPSYSGSSGGSSAANTGSSGSGTAFNVMPEYERAYCWKRIN